MVPVARGLRALGFYPPTKHQESPFYIFFFFFAGSSRLPSVDPQCGREAFSPAPETQTPDVREVSPRRFEDRAEPGSANQEISRSLPSTETPSLFSLPNPPGFWSSVRLLGGGAGTAGAGADPKPGSSGRGGGARRPPPPPGTPRPARPGGPRRGERMRRCSSRLCSKTGGRLALLGGGGSSPSPASALPAPLVPARPAAASLRSASSSRRGDRRRACAAVWASIWAVHRRPLPGRRSCRGADKDAAGGSRGAAGPRTRVAPGHSGGRGAP